MDLDVSQSSSSKGGMHQVGDSGSDEIYGTRSYKGGLLHLNTGTRSMNPDVIDTKCLSAGLSKFLNNVFDPMATDGKGKNEIHSTCYYGCQLLILQVVAEESFNLDAGGKDFIGPCARSISLPHDVLKMVDSNGNFVALSSIFCNFLQGYCSLFVTLIPYDVILADGNEFNHSEPGTLQTKWVINYFVFVNAIWGSTRGSIFLFESSLVFLLAKTVTHTFPYLMSIMW
ncbi:uncharacterized protein [Elaeis guineensis]|uniref:uncharacterized protein isoform X1 n=1 Tax=Elaeis guineensis var. tenera TaxID=51953 RepID=UPI003C6D0444